MDYEQLGLTLPESTLSWEAHRASVRPLLASVLELLTRATAGPNIYGSFAKLSPDGSWLKIALGCSQLTMDGSLETFSGVWPRRATMFAGIVGEPPTSERRISGTGFLSSDHWATPNTMDFLPQRSTEALIRQATTTRKGRSAPANLREQIDPAVVATWPTPTTRGYHSPTPPGSPRAERKAAQGWTVDLNDAVAMWATPTVNDAKNATLPPSQIDRGSVIGDTLRCGISGLLNPDWDEVLMGYEPGWTRLPSGWKAKGGRKAGGQTNTIGSHQE